MDLNKACQRMTEASWSATQFFEALYIREKQIECSRYHLRISWSFLLDHYNYRCHMTKLMQSLIYAILLGIWVNSGSWWWTWRPGVLWFTGSQRVRHDWATELNWTELNWTELGKNKVKEWGHTVTSHVFRSKALYPMMSHNGKKYEKVCVYIYV